MPEIRFVGSRAQVTEIANQLAAIMAGREVDTYGISNGFLLSLGFGALSDIRQAFIDKAAGRTGEDRVKWEPLSPQTIANRRVGRADQGYGKRVTRNPGQSSLEAAQQALLIRRRVQIVNRETKKALNRFRASGLTEGEALRRARIVGQLKATQLTGKTKVETLGHRQVEILRDTGVLLNSLSPGLFSLQGGFGTYTKPAGDGGDEQIFRVEPGAVIVGTTVAYASAHQRGNKAKGLPARKILPDKSLPVPDIWWERWSGIAVVALAAAAVVLFQRGAPPR